MPNDLILRLSVRQYHAMVGQGILTDDDGVELLEGYLIAKRPKNPPHSKSTGRAQRHLDAVLPVGYFTRAQEPVTLADSEPEPDVAVVRGTDELYSNRHPGPADVPLVIEVADSTLERDRTLKLQGYARAGIPVYWIVNLVARQVEVYHEPAGATETPAFARPVVYAESDSVPVMIDGHEVGRVRVIDLLP